MPPINARRPWGLTHVLRRLREQRIDSRVAPDAAIVDGLLLGSYNGRLRSRARSIGEIPGEETIVDILPPPRLVTEARE